MSKVRARTVTWGALVFAVGVMLAALALGVQLTPVTVVVILLVVTGVMLALFALRPSPDDARATPVLPPPGAIAPEPEPEAESAPESELLDGSVGQQQPLDAGGAEIDPRHG